MRGRVGEVGDFCEVKREELTLVQAALKFVLADPGVSVVIPGIKTPTQAGENASASVGKYHRVGDVFSSEEVESGFGGDA